MPKGKGSYGRQVGRPAKKKKENAREAAIRRSGKKTLVGKFRGKMTTGKASPHTDRDESPLGKMTRSIEKILSASQDRRAQKALKELLKVKKGKKP